MLFLLAAEGGGEVQNPLIPPWQEIVLGLIAFGLLCFVLMRFVFPQMEKTFAARVDAIEGGIRRAEAAQAEANQLLEQYRAQLAEARTALAHLKETRVDAERMARDVELAKAVYLQSSKRLDDARLTIGLNKQQLTNVAVIEPPRASPAGRSLKQAGLVAILGGVVGLGLGVATALALDFCNWSLRTPEDVEFYLGVPALAAIPAVLDASRPLRAIGSSEDRDMDPAVRDEHERDERGRDKRGRG